jgi:hypothetical protein
MRFSQLVVILGCTIAAFGTIAPLRAEAAKYQVQSGVTSVYHDLEAFSQIGLDLTGSNNTVTPINNDYIVGFSIAPTTNFTFSDTNGFTPLSGTIEHTGTVTFNNQNTVGNFSVGYDPQRANNNASGLFLKDTFSQLILFDLSAPETVSLNGNNLILDQITLFFSPELANSSLLNNSNLAGEFAGIVRIDAQVVLTAIPEPTSTIGLIVVGIAVLRTRCKKQM